MALFSVACTQFAIIQSFPTNLNKILTMEHTALQSFFQRPELMGYAATPQELERLILRVTRSGFFACDIIHNLPRSGRISIPHGVSHPLIRPYRYGAEYDAEFLARDFLADRTMRYAPNSVGNNTQKGWEVHRLWVDNDPVPLLFTAWMPSFAN